MADVFLYIYNYTMADILRIVDTKIGRDEEPFVAFWSGRDGYLDQLLHPRTSNQERNKIVDNLSINSRRYDCLSISYTRKYYAGEIKFLDCDAAVVVRPLGLPDDDYRTMSYALVGRADVADIEGDEKEADDMAAKSGTG